MIRKIRIILFFTGATLVAAHCLIGKAAFAATQESGQPCPPECVTDSMEIVTWYPSPYNEYEELRLYPISVSNSECNDYNRGLMYYDSDEDKVKLCKGPAGLNNWKGLGYWEPSTIDTADIYYTDGNVGIGTTNPDPGAKLEVTGTALVKGTTGSGPKNEIFFDTTYGSPNNHGIKIKEAGWGTPYPLWGILNNHINGGLTFAYESISSGRTFSSPTNVLHLGRDGNVGIGTTEPKSPLQIGPISPTILNPPPGPLNMFANRGGRIYGNNIYFNEADLTYHRATSSFYPTWIEMDNSNIGDIWFCTAGPGPADSIFTTTEMNTAPKMTIKNNGNVGIGTTGPQGALDITSTTGAFIVPRMTQAQRDALTVVNGMIIYNTTANRFNFYENGAWQ